MTDSPHFVVCRCRHCDCGIEFDVVALGEEKQITVPCPHCRLETILFVPPQQIASTTIPSSNTRACIRNGSAMFVIAGVGLVFVASLFVFVPPAIATTVAMIAIPLFVVGFFVVLHLRPLNTTEITQLASKRRLHQIQAYYQFCQHEVSVNLEFKKSMAAEGAYYNIHTSLREFPSLAAALLKYKKHEWIIIGFEKEQQIALVCLNKGPDNNQVASHLSYDGMAKQAKTGGHTSVIVLHNHPNPNPGSFNMSSASEQDMRSAKALESVLLPASINLLEFVCERGRFFQFYRAIAPAFIPNMPIVATIMGENNKSRFRNFRLHLERMF